MGTAVVVGSGPNGLAGAVELARNGMRVTVLEASDRIGGGTRTTEKLVDGTLHDECSAVHPMAALSPFLRGLELERYGLRWLHPAALLAHPLDDGECGVLRRSVEETASGFTRADGRRWQQVFGALAQNIDTTAHDLLGPFTRWPGHPVRLAQFGLRAAPPATLLSRAWRAPAVRGLFLGAAAHIMHDLRAPMTSSVATMLIAAGHRFGWPVAEGGSRAISDALAALLETLGGRVITGQRVTSLRDFPDADVVLLDTAPAAAADIVGHALPRRVDRAYRRWRHGPSAFKVDFVVREGVPWKNELCGQAGTVHLGGSPADVVRGARDVSRGVLPESLFVLVGQQYVADPSRSAGDAHPVWAYAHVPHGYTGDATPLIVEQIERFAPGFSARVIASSSKDTEAIHSANANFVGGDILTGGNDLRQLLLRPRPALDPYYTGVPGVYLCSAATPPGAGVHGMNGYHAARRALAGLTTDR
nr:NAD(P)/FAD-dependent oxidoreductase [Kibdelosporangium sp. MJ126-NF4]